MYKIAFIALKDGRIHVFSYGTLKGYPPAIDQRVVTLAAADVDPGALGVATREALEKYGHTITSEDHKAQGDPLEAILGPSSDRKRYVGVGSVIVELTDRKGPATYALRANQAQGKNLLPDMKTEKRLASGCPDAQLGAEILGLLEHSRTLNSPRDNTRLRTTTR